MSFQDSLRLLGSLWSSSIPLAGPSKLPASTGLHDSCTKGFHFLVRLAWESRYLLPIMYAVISFIFDTQMRLEIIIHRERRVVVVEEEVMEAEAEEEEDSSGSESGDDESVGQFDADEVSSEIDDTSSEA